MLIAYKPLRSALAVLFTASLCASCASAPAFSPSERTPQSAQLIPFEPTRLRPHPAHLTSPTHPMRAPGQSHSRAHLAQGPLQASAYLWWRVYGETYGRASGPTCNFSPTCSRFGLEASAYGPRGLIWTFGRLQRDQRPDDFYATTPDGHLSDPIANYAIWTQAPTLDRSPYVETPHHGWYLFVRALRAGLARDILERRPDSDVRPSGQRPADSAPAR
ncbi:hypothetical protein DL240_00600 [Lujinxingia litoralis]|uniref:Membrane protein insertion efficiency factor YidD n=1 Tax=Lujinxingia litoralis TaxID=2211119 RepID=A0A328CDJ0_9DELT|nr:membrane protein insertion efficiency factor YidD [Lujinxingia litoralis]RAL24743.1 hypothetical protein DL240_00600 [Lujinxingia litoralis]